MSTTGIRVERAFQFFDHNPIDSDDEMIAKTQNQQYFRTSTKNNETNTPQINNINQTHCNSNTTSDNSTELTAERITPTETFTSNSSLPPESQTGTKSDALILDA